MTKEITFGPDAMRHWLTVCAGTNPWNAIAGPIPQLQVPLLLRTTAGVQAEILRTALWLSLDGTLIGTGELGLTRANAHQNQAATVTVQLAREAIAEIIDPPGIGRVPLTARINCLVRFMHTLPGETQYPANEWTAMVAVENVGTGAALDLDVARSDWHDYVIARLGSARYLTVRLHLPNPAPTPTWAPALAHLAAAEQALTTGNAAGVFSECRAALDALPGAKTAILADMALGPRRDALDQLTKAIGTYHHSGRHVTPVTPTADDGGTFPVTRDDAAFVHDLTRLLLSHIAAQVLPAT